MRSTNGWQTPPLYHRVEQAFADKLDDAVPAFPVEIHLISDLLVLCESPTACIVLIYQKRSCLARSAFGQTVSSAMVL